MSNYKNDKKVILTKKMKDFLETFEKNVALVGISCKKFKIHRDTYYRWIKENHKFRSEVEEVKELTKDRGEHALHSLIDQKNPQAVIFYNKTKNKDRGYIEKTEVQHSGEMQSNIDLSLINLCDAYNESESNNTKDDKQSSKK